MIITCFCDPLGTFSHEEPGIESAAPLLHITLIGLICASPYISSTFHAHNTRFFSQKWITILNIAFVEFCHFWTSDVCLCFLSSVCFSVVDLWCLWDKDFLILHLDHCILYSSLLSSWHQGLCSCVHLSPNVSTSCPVLISINWTHLSFPPLIVVLSTINDYRPQSTQSALHIHTHWHK